MRALVTTANTPASLFVVRRLNQLGYNVTAVDSHTRGFVSHSNAVSKTIIAPSLRYDPHGFAKAVIDELKSNQYDFYFPILECGFLMAYYQEEIRKYTKMVTMPYADIAYAHNKNAMREYAREANVRTPHTEAPGSLREAFSMLDELESPIVIKPRVACNAHGQRIILDPKTAAWEYGKVVKDYGLENELPIFQQHITGNLICTVNLAVNGEIKSNVVFRSLRTVPTSGGTSSYRETVSLPEAELFDARLIKHFNWTGFISFDYMEEASTGKLYLIDCNPRIAPGVTLAYYAGVDMIATFLDLLHNRELSEPVKQQDGVRSKLQFLDLGWLLYNLTDKSLSAKEKFQCFKTWSKREKSYNDIESMQDIRPALSLYGFIFRNIRKLLTSSGGEIFLEHALFDEGVFLEGFTKTTSTII